MSQPVLPRLFVVDDELILVSTLAIILNMSGFRAIPFTSAERALQAAETEAPSILLSDGVESVSVHKRDSSTFMHRALT